MKRFLPLLGVLFLIGCGPSVQISPPAYTDIQQTGVINIAIEEHHSHIGKPSVQIFPKYQPLAIMDISNKLKQMKPGEYALELPNLIPDEYRIVMKVPYTLEAAGMGFASGQRLVTADFAIHQSLPVSCFRFDDKEKALMDWSTHGVYIDNRDKPVSKETCPGLFYVNNSWPYPLNDTTHGGSLFVPVSSECFPKTSPQLSQQSQWTFSLVSPDLRERQDWQHIQSIRFHMATHSISLSVRPEVQYVYNNADRSTFSDTQSPSYYDINGGRWNDYEYAFKLPAGAILTHVVFHVYGIPEKTVSDQVDSVYLDAVCPVK